MLDDLLPYYEKELSHLRFLGQEFAREYPKIAARLLIEGDNCEDPHTERLIESFSFLSARIHKKLDDEFPEIVEAFLEVLYPHYLRPTPALSIAEFSTTVRSTLTAEHKLERHTEITSRTVEGVACRFRTCYPVELWPVTVQEASFIELERSAFNGHSADLVAQLKIGLRANTDQHFGQLGITSLRFFLDGEGTLMHQLYELLFNNTAKATVSFTEAGQRREIALPHDALKPVGFEPEDGLVDYSPRSFGGYRLLHDYFTFTEKFLFFDFGGLNRLAGRNLLDIELNIYFDQFEHNERLARLAQTLGRNNFKLGCTPIVNLFKQQAEPIKLTHTQHEYPVTPNVRLQGNAEVVSIDRVQRVRKVAGRDRVSACHPFFEPRGELGPDACYWIARREAARRGQQTGTDMVIRVVDRELDLVDTGNDTLSISLTCSNRDLPQLLGYGGQQNDFTLEQDNVIDSIRLLRKPTPSARVPLGDGLLWRLIAHLSLNHMSLVSQGKEVLQEMLSLYNYRRGLAVRKQISGIVSITSEPAIARIGHPRPNFVRGVGITVELDESQYIGSGVFLFGMLLDRFFGQYCTVNSFTQLTLRTRQREKSIVKWPPRTGDQPLV